VGVSHPCRTILFPRVAIGFWLSAAHCPPQPLYYSIASLLIPARAVIHRLRSPGCYLRGREGKITLETLIKTAADWAIVSAIRVNINVSDRTIF
jgi:hypothetical protein